MNAEIELEESAEDGGSGESRSPSPSDGMFSPEDPLALYREHHFQGPPATRFEAFRRFAVRSRRFVYGLLLAGIVGPILLMMTSRQPESAEEILLSYFNRASTLNESSPLYSIGEARFAENQLRRLFGAVLKFTWGEKGSADGAKDQVVFDQFAREQYETDLLVSAALKEGTLRSAEARLILENAVRHAAADYYLYRQMASADSNFRITVPREEVLAVYAKNKEFYTRHGVDEAAALPLVEHSLAEVRRAEMNRILVRVRQQLVAELRDRSGSTYKGSVKK